MSEEVASQDGIEIIRDADGNVNVTVVVDYAGMAGTDIQDWALLSGGANYLTDEDHDTSVIGLNQINEGWQPPEIPNSQPSQLITEADDNHILLSKDLLFIMTFFISVTTLCCLLVFIFLFMLMLCKN